MERNIDLYLRLLPAGVIIKNFVKGGGAYDYEFFLRELINQSPFSGKIRRKRLYGAAQ